MVMGLISTLLITTLLLIFVKIIEGQGTVFDITKHGAKADGVTDMTQAFLDTWKEACASKTPSTLLIPAGTFAMNSVKVIGPCGAPLEFRLVGTLKAPAETAAMKGADGFITINNVDRLTVTGGGVFDGQGAKAWAGNDCATNKDCARAPINLRFNSVTNSIVRDVTTKDSKNFHVNLIGCNNFTMDNFTVSTPETSINTDGIHLGRCKDVKIINSEIKAGDDCVSIGDGTINLLVENVNCGPGHGFSIGSLGRNMGEADIVGVTFKNCTLTGTTNGVRIKSWPSSPSGYKCTVSDVHFEDITMNDVQNPVIIDQVYCPSNACNKNSPSRVKISGVSIKNIKGTFTTAESIQLICSSGFPCEKVELGDIDLKFVGTTGTPTSICDNVKPILSGKQNPPVCTATSKPS